MKKNYTCSNGSYAVINGELTHVSVKERFAENDEHIKYVLERVMEGDKRVPLGEFEDIKLYYSRALFEKGESSVDNYPLDSRCSLNDKGELEVWKMEDGEPKASYTGNLVVKVKAPCSPVLPDGCYISRDECLKNETYIERKDDGTSVEHRGVMKRIKLTDEQEKYIQEVLLPALDGCKELGIQLVVSSWEETLFAYNKNGFSREVWDGCEPEWTEQYAQLCDMRYVSNLLYCVGDDNAIYDGEEEEKKGL